MCILTSTHIVHGFIDETYPNVQQYLGIPFAKPPVGNLRFKPSQPITNPSKYPINAQQYPPACPQYATTAPSVQNQDAPETLPDLSSSIDEDCLKLSVWTPTSSTKGGNLPVIIWIYGGGFDIGSTKTGYQVPRPWIQRSKRHIVVGIQYRLNIFGFPNTPELETQNLGLLDQRLAIEWVRDNIAAFGGDADRITLWGQSAGANSVDILNFAYKDDPIANGMICDSGSALMPLRSEDYPGSNFTFVARHFGCGGEGESEVECLQSVPAKDITAFLEEYGNAGTTPQLKFVPIADDKVFFENYTAQYEKGAISTIPAIFGTNMNDAVSLIPYPDNPANPPNETLAHIGTLSFFLCPAVTSSTQRDALGRDTYRYYYTGNFSNVSPRYWEGAYHASELPMVFGTYDQFRGPGTEFEKETSEKMQDLWLKFAENPAKPNGWQEYRTGNGLEFGTKGTNGAVVKNLKGIDAPCS